MKVVVLLLLAGCGSVTTTGDVDSGTETHTVEPSAPSDGRLGPADASVPDSTSPVDTSAPVDTHAETAPTCGRATSVPYCASCRDARGVCYCGALPCCDQHCQS